MIIFDNIEETKDTHDHTEYSDDDIEDSMIEFEIIDDINPENDLELIQEGLYEQYLRTHEYDPVTNTVLLEVPKINPDTHQLIRGERVSLGKKLTSKERQEVNRFLKEHKYNPNNDTILTDIHDADGNTNRRITFIIPNQISAFVSRKSIPTLLPFGKRAGDINDYAIGVPMSSIKEKGVNHIIFGHEQGHLTIGQQVTADVKELISLYTKCVDLFTKYRSTTDNLNKSQIEKRLRQAVNKYNNIMLSRYNIQNELVFRKYNNGTIDLFQTHTGDQLFDIIKSTIPDVKEAIQFMNDNNIRHILSGGFKTLDESRTSNAITRNYVGDHGIDPEEYAADSIGTTIAHKHGSDAEEIYDEDIYNDRRLRTLEKKARKIFGGSMKESGNQEPDPKHKYSDFVYTEFEKSILKKCINDKARKDLFRIGLDIKCDESGDFRNYINCLTDISAFMNALNKAYYSYYSEDELLYHIHKYQEKIIDNGYRSNPVIKECIKEFEKKFTEWQKAGKSKISDKTGDKRDRIQRLSELIDEPVHYRDYGTTDDDVNNAVSNELHLRNKRISTKQQQLRQEDESVQQQHRAQVDKMRREKTSQLQQQLQSGELSPQEQRKAQRKLQRISDYDKKQQARQQALDRSMRAAPTNTNMNGVDNNG